MILEVGQVCPYSHNCPYNKTAVGGVCYGTRSDRANRFECEFVINGKIITDAGFRNSLDQTGKMKIIME